MKFVNILPEHTSLNYHLQSIYNSSDHKIWIALLGMHFTFLLVKLAINNTQEALKNFGVYSKIKDVHIGNFWGTKKIKQESFHSHFAEGLHQGERDLKVRLIDQE